MLALLDIVLPVFVVIGGGYVARATKVFTDSHADALMYFTQNFAIPCLLFQAVARLDLGAVFHLPLLLSFYTGSIICFTLSMLGARQIFGRRPGESVAVGFCALFANSVLLGLPIMERAYGPDSLAPNYAIIAIHAPFCYVLGITTMEFIRADGQGVGATLRAVAKAVFSNGLMIGLGLGFIFNLAGLRLPGFADAAVTMLGQAGLPVALFALGAVLVRYRINESLGEVGMIVTLRLVVHPAIAYGLGAGVFGLSDGFLRGVVVAAAMAPGVNTFVFANMYDRAKGTAASGVLVGTLASIVSVSVWLTWLP